eukprot:CAMPEP_0117443294 /NCGR_PEP_ID=MMETSP0759-20121206/4617_1 /TAXON_ID=63605 /ORGANISM="Percolomonas cosmopolitus, Strain WS" /LENGTH=188 /DNA_ID=CAMNT_0005235257 /DNA_START=81 /DNA_END=647 /DNA_ORIENTATION=+
MGNLSTKVKESIEYVGKMLNIEWMHHKNAKLLILGLDAAGKSTILYHWKLGEEVVTIPTIGFNVETLQYKNITMTTFDLGGQSRIRSLWRYYFDQTDGVIYVVDSADVDRVRESAQELHRVLADDRMNRVPVLVLANKQDLPESMTADKIVENMRMGQLKNDWYVQPCVGITGAGLIEGMEWLGEHLK